MSLDIELDERWPDPDMVVFRITVESGGSKRYALASVDGRALSGIRGLAAARMIAEQLHAACSGLNRREAGGPYELGDFVETSAADGTYVVHAIDEERGEYTLAPCGVRGAERLIVKPTQLRFSP